jgi:chemotaxis signal transduction protein
MSTATTDSNAQLRALREAFDLGFAQAPHALANSPEKLLAIRLNGAGYAVRVAEIGGLHLDRRIMPLPTQIPELIGMAGFRGQITPVYDLAALLGYARQTSPRWLILLRQRETVALAFDAFEAHFAVAPEQILRTQQTTSTAPDAARPHLNDAVRTETALLPIINLSSLLETIRRQGDLSARKGALNHE